MTFTVAQNTLETVGTDLLATSSEQSGVSVAPATNQLTLENLQSILSVTLDKSHAKLEDKFANMFHNTLVTISEREETRDRANANAIEKHRKECYDDTLAVAEEQIALSTQVKYLTETVKELRDRINNIENFTVDALQQVQDEVSSRLADNAPAAHNATAAGGTVGDYVSHGLGSSGLYGVRFRRYYC